MDTIGDSSVTCPVSDADMPLVPPKYRQRRGHTTGGVPTSSNPCVKTYDNFCMISNSNNER